MRKSEIFYVKSKLEEFSVAGEFNYHRFKKASHTSHHSTLHCTTSQRMPLHGHHPSLYDT